MKRTFRMSFSWFFNLFGIFFCFSIGPSLEDDLLHLGKSTPERVVPSSYMMNLYNRLKDGYLTNIGSANTIRSFHPVPGKLGNRDVLIFNISGVYPSEYIERVDMHLHWKRPNDPSPRRRKNKNNAAGGGGSSTVFRLSVLDLDRPTRPEMETVLLRQRPSYTGWHRLDLTDAIIACLDGEDRSHHVIGFSARSEGQELQPINVTETFAEETFLVIFSEDDEHQEVKDVAKVDNNGNASILRKGREILDNELPDYPFERSFGTSREEIQARIKHRALESFYSGKSSRKSKDNWNGKRRRRTRKQKQEQQQQQKQQLKWRKNWWKDDFYGPGDPSSEEYDDKINDKMLSDESFCQRRSFVIDFAKIGWNHWIIAPKNFDVHECSGRCSTSMTQITKPSNHATLKILAQQRIGKMNNDDDDDDDNVLQLCCVPQSLSAAPLLFYDDNKNIVLKQFPGMRVENCTCR